MTRASRPPVLDPNRRARPEFDSPTDDADASPLPSPVFAARPTFDAGLPAIVAPPARPRRRWLRVTALLLVLAGAGAAYQFGYVPMTGAEKATDSVAPVSPAATGSGSTAPGLFPTTAFPRPTISSATWAATMTDLVAASDGTVSTRTVTVAYATNFVVRVGRLTVSGEDPAAAKTAIFTDEAYFRPAEAFGAPWTRIVRGPDAVVPAVLDERSINMFDEVVTAAVRANAIEVTTSPSTIDPTWTTYTFRVDGHFLGTDADPGVLGEFAAGSADVVDVELTIDAAGVIRRWSLRTDEEVGREELARSGSAAVPFVYSGEVTSLDEPVDVATPSEWVDAPAVEQPAPTTAPAPPPAAATAPVPPATHAPAPAPAPSVAPTPASPAPVVQSAACAADRLVVQAAVDAFTAANPGHLPEESQLVPGYLAAESTLHNVSVLGTVIPTHGSGCAWP